MSNNKDTHKKESELTLKDFMPQKTPTPQNEVKNVQKEVGKVSYELRKPAPDMPEEILGRDGLEPTRFGDWEVDGKCTDF